MKKTFAFMLVGIFMFGFVTAAWLFTINGGFTAVVESLPGYAELDLDINSLSVDTTNGSDSAWSGTQFILNKDMTLSVGIVETFQDNSGGECLGGEDDCTMIYYVEESGELVEIVDKQVINLTAEPLKRSLNASLSCEAYSCPQSRSAEITLTEVLA